MLIEIPDQIVKGCMTSYLLNQKGIDLNDGTGNNGKVSQELIDASVRMQVHISDMLISHVAREVFERAVSGDKQK